MFSSFFVGGDLANKDSVATRITPRTVIIPARTCGCIPVFSNSG